MVMHGCSRLRLLVLALLPLAWGAACSGATSPQRDGRQASGAGGAGGEAPEKTAGASGSGGGAGAGDARGGPRPQPPSPDLPRADAGGILDDVGGAVDAGTGGSAGMPPSDTRLVTGPLPAGAVMVLDLDLRGGVPTMPAGMKFVQRGGAWEEGWRVKTESDQLMIDCGREIAEGVLEITFSMMGDPTRFGAKGDYAGMWELPALTQEAKGDFMFVRQGAPQYGFSMPKVVTWTGGTKNEWHRIPEGAEKTMGLDAWSKDDSRDMTVGFKWQAGVVSVFLPVGGELRCPPVVCAADRPVDRLRYIAVGTDNYRNGQALPGQRFRRVRLYAFSSKP